MHHRFKKLAGALAAIGLAGLTMAGTSTAHAAVLPPDGTWVEIFAPEIHSIRPHPCQSVSAANVHKLLQNSGIMDSHRDNLAHAVQEGYRGLLMTGRYAVAFLFLELPADHVDVNVHPTKSEVRFRHAQALHHLIYTAVKARLRQANLTARLQVTSAVEPAAPLGDRQVPLR